MTASAREFSSPSDLRFHPPDRLVERVSGLLGFGQAMIDPREQEAIFSAPSGGSGRGLVEHVGTAAPFATQGEGRSQSRPAR